MHQNNLSSFKHSYQIIKKNRKIVDTDVKNNTEVSVFQYVFEIRSIIPNGCLDAYEVKVDIDIF